MEYLFDAWQHVRSRLKKASHVFLLTDFDGTLTPIVERPEKAVLSQEMRQLLQALAKNRRFTVGVISGRSLRDLEARVGIRGIVYAGNHGLELEGPGINVLNPIDEEAKSVMNLLHRILSRALSGVRGVFVENKGLTLSIHYRQAEEEDENIVKQIFETVTGTARMLGKIKITFGKKVYEVRPPIDWDKGKAIAWLLERYRNPQKEDDILAVYLGDDLTDEDGFKVIEEKRGISIYVGEESRQSLARYFLRSPGEVEGFLSMLAKEA